MVKRFVSVLTIAISLLSAGCLERRIDSTYKSPAKSSCCSDNNRIDTPAGMIEYLNQQNLPALESVESWRTWFSRGLKLTTAHYEIYTTLLEPLMLRDIPAFLESCYSSYQKQLPKDAETKVKFTVYLFSNRTQWEIFTILFAGRQASKYTQIRAGAYYYNGCCIAYNIGRERTFRVLGHECWHQFADRVFKFRLPSWLNEGIALQFESNAYKKGFFYFEPGRNLYRLGSLKKTIVSNRMIDLKDLIAASPGEAIEQGSNMASAYYSQLYALVRFLNEAGRGNYREGFARLLDDGFQGRWPLSPENVAIAADKSIPITVSWNQNVGSDLFRQYIESDFDKIEEEYIDFCKRIVQNVRLKPLSIEQINGRQAGKDD